MSRIGSRPIIIEEGIKVGLEGSVIRITGPKGELTQDMNDRVKLIIDNKEINVHRADDDKKAKAFQGLSRSLIANMVAGVTKGFSKTLNIVGVGYRAEVKGDMLHLTLGYSHPIEFRLPKGISARVDKQVQITIEGIDKQLVGETAAKIRSFRKPEPYKGKGILYSDEKIRRKIGKAGIK